MQQQTFADKFLKHLDKIDRTEVEAFIQRTVRERDFVARLFEVLIEGIVVVDDAFQVSMINAAARRILRLPSNRRILGDPLVGVLAGIEPLLEIVLDFIGEPVPVLDEEVVLHPDTGRVYSVHLLPIAPADASDGEDRSEARQAGAALILHDVTPTREKQARNAQAEKLASLATLTAGVAHEIKNPLNSLSIHAQLLDRAVADLDPDSDVSPEKREKTARRVKESCSVIAEEVDRLRQCVDDFIEAARPRRPRFQPADINRLVRVVVDMATLEFEDRGIRIETGLDPDLPLARVDDKMAQSALRNLMRNAVEAIEAARRPRGEGLITLRTRVVDEMVALEVADNGCGIPSENVTKIFEPYFTTKFNGSGLGLMAVARIVRDHEGHLSVDSREGEGTTFTLEFPIVTQRIKLLEASPGTDEAAGDATP